MTRLIAFGTVLMLAFSFGGSLSAQQKKADKPVKVFILAGQSNMVGMAQIELLKHQIHAPETKERFAHFHNDGVFVERDDVHIKFLNRHGKLTVGYGGNKRLGPELQFGFTVGDHFEEPVLLIKTAWGGKSLYRDFRPPNAPSPDSKILEKQLANAQKKKPETNLEDIEGTYGHYYRLMMADVKQTLENIEDYVPEYNDRGYELCGFAWFQGWNDMVNSDFVPAYTDLMAQFIRDVRTDLEEPNLPFVVGVLGVGGTKEKKKNEGKEQFKRNQAAVGDLEEFKGNVAIVHTDQFWDMRADEVFNRGWRENLEEWKMVGSDRPYHYLGSVKCYSDIGNALAEALLELKSGSKQKTSEKLKVGKNFLPENLVAWCIVPFDAKKRGPVERAKMVRELGLKRVAYDWRPVNKSEFEEEIQAYQANGVEYFAHWKWDDSMAPLIKKYGIKPQIWQIPRSQKDGTEEEQLAFAIKSLEGPAKAAKELGLKFAVYNHGGWIGEPATMVKICEMMRASGLGDVGIVYNFHHAHDHFDGFADKLKLMKPYLLCVNLNGMVEAAKVDPKTKENKILPLGQGTREAAMIEALLEIGYDGPIGVLGHRKELDAKEAVQLNLDGLDSMVEIKE